MQTTEKSTEMLKELFRYDQVKSHPQAFKNEIEELEKKYYYRVDELVGMPFGKQLIALTNLTRKYGLRKYEQDYNGFWPNSFKSISSLSENSRGISRKASELGYDYMRMAGPDRMKANGVVFDVEPGSDHVLFATYKDVEIVRTWNITQEEIQKAVETLIEKL